MSAVQKRASEDRLSDIADVEVKRVFPVFRDFRVTHTPYR